MVDLVEAESGKGFDCARDAEDEQRRGHEDGQQPDTGNDQSHARLDDQRVLLVREGGGRVQGAGSSSCCLLYTSPSPRDRTRSRMPSSA